MGATDNPSPAVQRRRLRTELRRARQEAGLTQDQVSAALEMSLSKVIRIEAGTVGVSANDLRALLSLYHVDDPDEVASLLALARAGRERPWQSTYRDVASPRLLQLIELEAAASSQQELPAAHGSRLAADRGIRPDHAEPAHHGACPADDVDALVEVRMKRQELLERDDSPAAVLHAG